MGEATKLAVLHDRLGDPVDLGVATNSLVEGIDHDDLEVLVRRILTDPVRAQDTESLKTTSNTFLRIKKDNLISTLNKLEG
jgi:hypothetical protein